MYYAINPENFEVITTTTYNGNNPEKVAKKIWRTYKNWNIVYFTEIENVDKENSTVLDKSNVFTFNPSSWTKPNQKKFKK